VRLGISLWELKSGARSREKAQKSKLLASSWVFPKLRP